MCNNCYKPTIAMLTHPSTSSTRTSPVGKPSSASARTMASTFAFYEEPNGDASRTYTYATIKRTTPSKSNTCLIATDMFEVTHFTLPAGAPTASISVSATCAAKTPPTFLDRFRDLYTLRYFCLLFATARFG